MVLATLTLFVVSLGFGVVVPLLPELAGGRAATDETTFAFVFAAYSSAKIVAQTPGGVLVDRIGARPVLLASLLAFTASLVGFVFLEDLHLFIGLRVVEGVATGLIYPAVFTLGLEGSAEDVSGRRIGLIGGIGVSGMVVGPALGGLLAPYGPRVPILVAVGAAVLVTSLCALKSSRSPAGRRASTPDTPRTLRREIGQISSLARDLAFIGAIIPVAFNKLTSSAFLGLLPLVGPDILGVGVTGVTSLFVVAGIGFAIAQPLGGLIADRVGARRFVIATIPPQLLAIAALYWANDFLCFVVGYGVYVVLASFVFTATLKHASDGFASHARFGSLFGILGTITDTMLVVGPLLFLNLYGSARGAVFLTMAGVGVGFFLVYLWLGGRVGTRLDG